MRPEAREEILPKAARMFEPLSGAEPLFSYAGLRPAGRDVNYVIGRLDLLPGPDQRGRDTLDRRERPHGHRRARE